MSFEVRRWGVSTGAAVEVGDGPLELSVVEAADAPLESSVVEAADAPLELSVVEAADAPLELSVVDAVLWACELSEDETEVGDLVDAALGRRDAVIIAEPEPCFG